MDDQIREKLLRVKNEIAHYERKIGTLESEIADLQRELDGFRQRYDRLVRPAMQRLEAVAEAIEELRKERHLRSHMQHARPLESQWTPPPDYVPVEVQFYRTWIEPKQNPAYFDPPPPPRMAHIPHNEQPKASLKKLYRSLARRYHPDLAPDEDERAYRNRVMALINDAYEEEDLDALMTLAEKEGRIIPDTPLAVLHLRKLETARDDLAWRHARLQGKYDDLLHSELMRLKIDTALAQSKGRDLLKEMAERLKEQYEDYMVRLDMLRRPTDD
ncbi:MAG: hypothetical protein HXY40_13545 [Chloroflexi bacterium]|nr:hypothetical protein [Chloroflexota bacterium]